jgi:hypothetical protein
MGDPDEVERDPRVGQERMSTRERATAEYSKAKSRRIIPRAVLEAAFGWLTNKAGSSTRGRRARRAAARAPRGGFTRARELPCASTFPRVWGGAQWSAEDGLSLRSKRRGRTEEFHRERSDRHVLDWAAGSPTRHALSRCL